VRHAAAAASPPVAMRANRIHLVLPSLRPHHIMSCSSAGSRSLPATSLHPALRSAVAMETSSSKLLHQLSLGGARSGTAMQFPSCTSPIGTGSGRSFSTEAAQEAHASEETAASTQTATVLYPLKPPKRKKTVTWYGTRISTDPTCPSVIKRKPTTPSQRHTAIIDKEYLWKGRPLKSLTLGLRSKGGRNNTGRITVRHRGGGNKRKYRIIDFHRAPPFHEGVITNVVERIEYDPNRSALIALLRRTTPGLGKAFSYIVCPLGIKIGQELESSRSQQVNLKEGNAMPLRFIQVGTLVHNIEMTPGRGAQLCRSAGTSAMLLEKDEATGLALLRMQSKEQRYVKLNCVATIGRVSNPEHMNQSMGKAGRNRWKGKRPTVRGVAMNPIDHPHGGGEGKKSGRGVSPWGWNTKGYKTVRRKNPMIRMPRWKAKL